MPLIQMLRRTFLAVFVGVASAICDQEDGFWLNSHTEGVTDFAHGGVPLSCSNNCFEGSLTTKIVDEAFKVAFNGSAPSSSAILRVQNVRKRTSRAFRLESKIDNDDSDFNKMNCVDPGLRADVANALNKVADHSCQGIVKTILYSINLPQWAVNCVAFTATRNSDVISD
ncbi:hypothetical protein COOONC_04395 [Cooperia oncophora]